MALRSEHSTSKPAQRVIACALCCALSVGALPAVAFAEPEDSTAIVEAEQAADEEAAAEAEASASESAASAAAAAKKKAAAAKKAKKKAAAAAKKRAEEKAAVATAKEAIAQMNELSVKLETASEDLNEEQKRLDKLKREIKRSRKLIKETDAALEETRGKVVTWAKNTYINGTVRYMSVLLGATTFGDFVTRLGFMTEITAEEQKAVKRVIRLQNNLREESKQLKEKYVEQKQLTASVSEKATTVQEALLEQANYFAALPSDVREKVLAYDGVKNSLPSTAGLGGSTSTAGSHPEVVTEALKYLGTPYVWGGETTKGFDCSGLTMYCYKKAAGVSLTHFARTQFSEGLHISRAALMPGDLVFFGDSVETIHHVGIYLGNDKFVHAPHTGDVVKISTLSSYSDYIGACRP